MFKNLILLLPFVASTAFACGGTLYPAPVSYETARKTKSHNPPNKDVSTRPANTK